MEREQHLKAIVSALYSDMDRTLAAKREILKVVQGRHSDTDVENYQEGLALFEDVVTEVKDCLSKGLQVKKPVYFNKTYLCPTCNHRVKKPNWSYCHQCGQKLKGATA